MSFRAGRSRTRVRENRFSPRCPIEPLELRCLLASVGSSSLISPTQPWIPATDIRYAPANDYTRSYTQYELLAPNNGGVSQPAGTSGPQGYSPSQVRTAYGVNNILFGSITGDGSGQTIAIVDAYDDRSLVSSTDSNFSISDLARFDAQFGLPDPPSFTKVNQSGGTNYPRYDSGWAAEIALDVEWSHAIAPQASIILVEATNSFTSNLYAAVNWAKAQPGISAISMSFGSSESSGETSYDSTFTTPSGHAGVTFFAASGDSGAPGLYPAYSPNVVAVGGTTLNLADSTGTYLSESGWSSGGGGISSVESKPAYQNLVTTPSTTYRTIPDISLDANPSTGISVLDSSPNGIGSGNAWYVYGGTSISTPMWAGLAAMIDQGRALEGLGSLDGPTQFLPRLYALTAADFHDVTSGNNGYSAGAGYDLVTGRGTPRAAVLVEDLAGATIGGTVFHDNNSNNTLDSGESGVSGITVYIDSNHNGAYDAGEPTTTTGSSGAYAFADQLGGATYIIREVLPAGYIATNGTSLTDSASYGQALNQNFGLFPFVFNGSSSADIYSVGIDPGDSSHVQIVETLGGSGTVTYTIAQGRVAAFTFNTGSGDDILNFNGPVTPAITFNGGAGNDTLNVNSGTYVLAADASSTTDNLAINVNGGNVVFQSTQHLASLAIADNALATMVANGNLYLQTAMLSIDPLGTLDLNDNDFIAGGVPFSTVQNWIFDGYSATPDSTRHGIISTVSQNSGGNAMLMVFDNALAGIGEWPVGSGNSAPANAICGKYTYFGDTNLDGTVTGDDYDTIDANLGTTGLDPGIAILYGDTNFDGNITGDDYASVDGNLGLGVGSPLATAQLIVQPPPTPAALIIGRNADLLDG